MRRRTVQPEIRSFFFFLFFSIMNSSRPSARYHSRWIRRSWRWQVDWLAQTTLYQVSQAQTAGWVKRNKKSGACSCTSWCSQATFQMLSEHFGSGRQQTCLDQCSWSSRTFDFVWLCHLCDLLTITVRDKPAAWLVTVMEWKSHRGAGGAPSNSLLTLLEKVSFCATTPAPVIVRATFSWPIYLLFCCSLPLEIV